MKVIGKALVRKPLRLLVYVLILVIASAAILSSVYEYQLIESQMERSLRYYKQSGYLASLTETGWSQKIDPKCSELLAESLYVAYLNEGKEKQTDDRLVVDYTDEPFSMIDRTKIYPRSDLVRIEKETKGNIVNVASIGGVRGCRAGVAYTASKHAIVGATKNTAYMYAGNGIRCNVVCPGGVETEVMNSQTNISQFGIGRIMAGLDSSIPQGQPEDISSAVLYIASEDAKFMTGAEIVIDGGVSCN